LDPAPSQLVAPARVAQCPLQLEARASQIRAAGDGGFVIVEAEVLRVHALADIVIPGTQHVNPTSWSPLIYNFRHYHGLARELGHTFRSETPTR
jgi:flavin reductase (DIM6/NTAB) family NADH-FMN oxidoreductase RutF